MKKHTIIMLITLLSLSFLLQDCGDMLVFIKPNTEANAQASEAKYTLEPTAIGSFMRFSSNETQIMINRGVPVGNYGGFSHSDYFEIYNHDMKQVRNIDYKPINDENSLGDVYLNPDSSYWLTETYRPSAYVEPNKYLRLFDRDGKEQFTINMLETFETNLILIGVDNSGNAYLHNDYSGFDSVINLYIVNQLGEPITVIEDDFRGYLRMAAHDDGRILILDTPMLSSRIFELSGTSVTLLRSFSHDIDDIQYGNIWGGSGSSLYLSENQNLHSFDLETNESKIVANWSDVAPSYQLNHYHQYPDRDPYVVVQSKLFKLSTDSAIQEVDDRAVITVAAYSPSLVFQEWIRNFNETSSDYRLELTDYKSYESANEMYGAFYRLNLDITSGNTPDIFIWEWLGGSIGFNAAAYSGFDVFANINEMLANDADVNERMFLSNLLSASESSDGALYELPIEFITRVLASRKAEIGLDSWTLDQFYEEHKKYPNAELAFGAGSDGLLYMFLANNTEEFIDWKAGTSDFENEAFIKLLEFLKTQAFKENMLYGLDVNEIAAGRQYLYGNAISKVSDIQKFTANFDDEVNFIGYPTAYGRGNAFLIQKSISIGKYSKHKDVIWEIIKGLYQEEFQKTNLLYFPSNLNALVDKLHNPEDYYESGGGVRWSDTSGNYFEVIFRDTTESEQAQVKDLVFSIDRVSRQHDFLYSMIIETAAPFFAVESTAEETAKNIQYRVSIYLSENAK